MLILFFNPLKINYLTMLTLTNKVESHMSFLTTKRHLSQVFFLLTLS